MVSADILRHFTTDAEYSSYCHPLDLYESHTTPYVIYRMWCSRAICVNSIQCKCNQPQLCQSTIWANYIMIVKTTSNRNVCCTWKGIIMFQIIFINDGCQLFINGILVGVKDEGWKLIPVMITLDSIPWAIIEVVSCECKANCCIPGVYAIKYHYIAYSPAKRESITIRSSSYVSKFWKWLSH